MTQHPEILAELEAWAEKHKLTDTRASILLTNNPDYISSLRRGRDILVSTLKKLRARMDEIDEGIVSLIEEGEVEAKKELDDLEKKAKGIL